MKQLFLIVFLLPGFWVSSQNPASVFFEKTVCAESKNASILASFTESNSWAESDLTYQRMEWAIDPAVKYISGAITSTIKSQIQNLQSIRFDLKQNMIVDSIKSGNHTLDFTHTGSSLEISLSRRLNIGEIDSLTVYYRGVPDESGFGSFVQDYHSGSPIIWTLSEPYGAMEWWPCKQSLSDKIDSIDIIVTCPESYFTASNGVLVSENVSDGKRAMHWKHRFPIATYLVAIAVANYERYSDFLELDDGGKIEILNYVYPENLESAKAWTPQTIGIMGLYNNLFGIYPFASEKYGHAQFGWGGGMEHQTMTFLSGFSFDLIAHELAHQWFGDYITLDSWHDIWLNEGFATFATGLAYEHLLGGVWYPVWKETLVKTITGKPDGSVYVDDTTNVSRVFNGRLSYYKGAYLLHMLRWVLGEEIFFKTLKDYVTDPEIANGFTSQEKLAAHFEAAGDTSLAEFFNDWYYGQGHPVYSANYSQKNESELRLTLSQSTTHSSVRFFEMPVPVRVYNELKTDSADFRLENKFNGQEFILNPGFLAGSIKIDPELWLISETSTIASSPGIPLLQNATVYPNPFSGMVNLEIPRGQTIIETCLYSAEGKLLIRSAGPQSTLDCGSLQPGAYFIRIKTDKNTFEEKLVRE